MIADSLNTYTYEYLLQEALNAVSDNYDKRQGSIIYDALAPACYRLAAFVIQLQQFYEDTFASTAAGTYLDLRVGEQGLTRHASTKALRKAYFADGASAALSVPIGSRFSTISNTNPLNYVVKSQYESGGSPVAGTYILECETAGAAGNNYTGALVNITHIQGLVTATMSDIITAGRDTETDAELRSRYYQEIASKSFGGNISQYDQWLKAISGIGDAQIYPACDGGGTVKCSIVDDNYAPVTQTIIDNVQALIDPTTGSGQGIGTAPIGHTVTIVTPTEVTINIAATLTLLAGYTVEQVQEPVEAAIQVYIDELRANWGIGSVLNEYSTSVFIARVISAILSVSGITNVTGTTINGSAADLALTENATTQQTPKLGTVTLSA